MEEVIQVEGLQKTFRTPFVQRKVVAVREASFSVRRGEVFGFLGPNGAGKTTTLKVLVGLIRPSAGRVRVLGGHPGSLPVMARVGYLPEQPYFYDYLTPVELLDVFGRIFGLASGERRRRIDALLEQVGLQHARNRRLRKFSKGMLQRVGIAQALLNDPELVLLDEPMSGLDPVGRKEVADLIVSLKGQGKTVFFSSHILADIERLCDRVLILHRGEVRHLGDLDALLSGGDRREVLVSGPWPADLGDLPGAGSPQRIGPGVHRLVVDRDRTGEVLGRLLSAGLEVVQVSDRKVSLEDLFMATAGEGPVGAREERE